MEEIIPIILGVSLANERLLEILKTQIPWLCNPSESIARNLKITEKEVSRKAVIQFITILTGWITASILIDRVDQDSIWSFNDLLVGRINGIPVFLIGVLSSAGSAFWNQVFSYTKAVKDIKKQHVISENQRSKQENRKSKYHSGFDQLNTTHPKF